MNALRRTVSVLVALVAAVLLAGCGSSGGSSATSTAPTAPNTITISNFTFAPASLTVAPGTKVTVHNKDTTAHTVTASDKSFDTGDIAAGATTTFTAPKKAGSYSYICDIHQYMQGTLTVR